MYLLLEVSTSRGHKWTAHHSNTMYLYIYLYFEFSFVSINYLQNQVSTELDTISCFPLEISKLFIRVFL